MEFLSRQLSKNLAVVRTGLLIAVAVAGTHRAAVGQDLVESDLARLLANGSTRARTVTKVVASGTGNIPLLLSWTRNPPPQVDQHGLQIGLADVFGQLKAREAIPFLIKNISLSRYEKVNTWLKTAAVISEQMPAVAALIRIGPPASTALIHASWEPMTPEDRLAAVFVISQIKGVSEARAFLSSALAEANMERFWAEEGLKMLDEGELPQRAPQNPR